MSWTELHKLDQQITLLINSFHCSFSDAVMKFLSDVHVWIPMYVIIVIFLFLRLGWRKALIVTVSLALTLVLCDQFSNIIKDAVERLRPCRDEHMLGSGLRVLEKGGGLYGFFSAHAANTFGFAICSTMGFRNDRRLKYRGYSAWIFIWAVLVSISRIFVGKHYLGDVLTGIVCGIIFGLLTGYLARIAISRFVKTGTEPR